MAQPPPPPLRTRLTKPPFAPAAERRADGPDLSGVVYRPVDFENSVHIDAQGQILAGNGKLEELASLAAYICRIASLAGEQLGLGPLTGLEVTLERGTLLLHRDEQGELVAIQPRPHVNLVQLRARLNL